NLWLTLLRDVADELRHEIREAVKEKLWRLKEQVLRALRNGEPQATHLQEDYQLLSAYQRLHQFHIDPAFGGTPDTTLAEIIIQTGSPEDLVRDLTAGPTADVTPGMLEDEPVLVKPARRGDGDLPQALPAPHRPSRLPTQPRAPVRASGMGACSCLFLLLFVGLLLVAVGCVIAYQFDPVKDWVKEITTAPDKPKMGEAAGPAIAELAKAKNASTGEVQITLYWANKNDLDLHVVCPSGEEIYFENRQKAGGKLDVDMNVKYEEAVAPAMENVFWPQGKAPKGTYKVYVVHFKNHGKADCNDPTPYTVRVIVRGVTKYFQGEITFNPQRNKILVHEFTLD
ncbi:MAG TPA: hypothetical protein VE988_18465, partial [Gemmataceae bacterium]|nr:hypothetical protein [Gemmataceae bacterium]